MLFAFTGPWTPAPGPRILGNRLQAKGFKKLLVWQKSYELTLHTYRLTKSFPKDELYGLTSQLRRAVTSITANISEGYERNHRKEYVQFLHISRGSLGEVETYLLLARDLEYLADKNFEELETRRSEVARLLQGLISSLS